MIIQGSYLRECCVNRHFIVTRPKHYKKFMKYDNMTMHENIQINILRFDSQKRKLYGWPIQLKHLIPSKTKIIIDPTNPNKLILSK